MLLKVANEQHRITKEITYIEIQFQRIRNNIYDIISYLLFTNALNNKT